MGDSGNREAMSTYSPAHIFVRSLEETCAYMGRDEEANDDARAPTTVGKLKPDTVPVVSAVGHGALAVAVSGGNTAVDTCCSITVNLLAELGGQTNNRNHTILIF